MPDKTISKLYYEIMEEEVRLARAVAYSIRCTKPFSVWEVMIPIVFIMGYMRTRQQRELFVQNFIFTKKLALQAARDQCTGKLTAAQALEPIVKKTRNLLDTLDPTIYSKSIQQAQLVEMQLLWRHYLCLLQCDRSNLADSIRMIYPTRENYLAFVKELRLAEKKVADAAIKTVGEQADPGMVSRIDRHTHRLRVKASERWFIQHEKVER